MNNSHISQYPVATVLKLNEYTPLAGIKDVNINTFISPDTVEVVLKKFGKKMSDSPIYATIMDDYNTLLVEFNELPYDIKDFIYWKSEITLNKNLEDVEDVDELEATCVNTYFEFLINDGTLEKSVISIITSTNLETGEKLETRGEEEVSGIWRYLPTDCKITFEEALNIYWNSEYRTTGNKVSIYKPGTFEYYNLPPFYVFGPEYPGAKRVLVNSVSGEVIYSE